MNPLTDLFNANKMIDQHNSLLTAEKRHTHLTVVKRFFILKFFRVKIGSNCDLLYMSLES